MSQKSKGGRPSKLTQETVNKLGALLQHGVYIETACDVVGINRDTLYKWIKIGSKKKSGLHRALTDTVCKAVGESEVKHVVVVGRAGTGDQGDVVRDKHGEPIRDEHGHVIVARKATASDWKASAWFLERRFRDRWGAKQTIEHQGDAAGAVARTPEERAELDAELEALEKADKLTEGL